MSLLRATEFDLDPEREVIRQRRELLLPLAWRKILQGLKERKLTRLGVRCAEITFDHYEPAPKAPMLAAQFNGPVVLTWQSSPSPTPLDRSSESSMTPGNGSDPARPSSSATDSLEKL